MSMAAAAPPPPPLVLLTGANGHVGFRILIALLVAGYNVRACVPDQAAGNAIRISSSISELHFCRVRLTIVEVGDLRQHEVYRHVALGVDYIIHAAGPSGRNLCRDTKRLEEEVVQPALKGTMSILSAALGAPTVKRVILTSSVMALMSWEAWALEDTEETDTSTIITEESRVPDSEPKNYTSDWHAYHTAISKAFTASQSWSYKMRPHFDVVTIHSSIVLGRHELATTMHDFMQTTNSLIIMPGLGANAGFCIPGATVHVEDVAGMHVRALDLSKVKTRDGARSLIAHSHSPGGIRWDDALDIIRRRFPSAVKSNMLNCLGSQCTKTKPAIHIDASATSKALGLHFQDFETQVGDLTRQFITLLRRVWDANYRRRQEAEVSSGRQGDVLSYDVCMTDLEAFFRSVDLDAVPEFVPASMAYTTTTTTTTAAAATIGSTFLAYFGNTFYPETMVAGVLPFIFQGGGGGGGEAQNFSPFDPPPPPPRLSHSRGGSYSYRRGFR